RALSSRPGGSSVPGRPSSSKNGEGRPGNSGAACRLLRLRAGPDHAELTGLVVLVEGGVDRSRQARIVQLDRDVGAVLLRHALPGGADLDIAGEDPEVRAAVAGRVERGKLRLGVELQRLDEAVEGAVFRLRESTDVSHCHSPLVFRLAATIAA